MAATYGLNGAAQTMEYGLGHEDEDAEHEDDPMLNGQMFIAPGLMPPIEVGPSHVQMGNLSIKEVHAGGGPIDNGETVAAVQASPGDDKSVESTPESEADTMSGEEVVSNISDGDMSDKASSDADSGAAAEWEEGSNDQDEEEDGALNLNLCIFCGEDEDHDPSEEYEEYLACSVCGENSHRQCARTADALISDEDASLWRCLSCVENALEPGATEDRTPNRRSSAPRLTRDLLPAQAGSSRPDSHSVFSQLIVNNDPLDGSRVLRKRKASTDEVEESQSVLQTRPTAQVDGGSVSAYSASPARALTRREEKVASSSHEVTEELRGASAAAPSPRTRSTRSRAPKAIVNHSVTVLRKTPRALVLNIRVKPSALAALEPKRKRDRPARPPKQHAQDVHPQPTQFSLNYATPFYSFHERENDEQKSKPYGGILSEADADTSKTMPQAPDKEQFNKAKNRAEEAWAKKSGNDYAHQKADGSANKIKCINFGGYEIDTWYNAPYPEEYSRNRVLYICEFCLKYMSSDYVAWRHKLKCPAKHPPGDEIYRDGSISVFEVDGRKNPVYSQNLCLMAKLFLGSKTLYYDVWQFLFYVMTEYDELGCRFVGYFSKEKDSLLNNVSCILTLPIHQRKGYGNLLIDFSYLLTRVEGKIGSPEKPLSDMGLVSYRNYWRLVLCYQLRNQRDPVSITELSRRTGMTADDIVSALEGLRALVRDPVTGTYALRLNYKYFEEYIEKWEAKNYVRLNPEGLVWTPFLLDRRSDLPLLEHASPFATIPFREGEGKAGSMAGLGQRNSAAGTQNDSGMAPADAGISEAKKADTSTVDFDPEGLSTSTPTAHENKTITPASTSGSGSQFKDLHLAIPPNSPEPSQQKRTLSRTNALRTNTPTSNPIPPTSHIPPTRFEIYPPLPGTTARRRAGRPFGSTRKRTSTPVMARRRGGIGGDGAYDVDPPRSTNGEVFEDEDARLVTGTDAGMMSTGNANGNAQPAFTPSTRLTFTRNMAAHAANRFDVSGQVARSSMMAQQEAIRMEDLTTAVKNEVHDGGGGRLTREQTELKLQMQMEMQMQIDGRMEVDELA